MTFVQSQRGRLNPKSSPIFTTDSPLTLSGDATLTRSAVQSIVDKLLRKETDADDSLMVQGLDSAGAVRLVDAINKQLDVEMPPTVLYSHPTVNTLSMHINQLKSGGTYATTFSNPGQHPHSADALSPISIVGIACRLPGGIEGTAEFWECIQAGTCVVDKVPFSRWDVDAITAADDTLSREVQNRMNWGGFVEDLELFDAGAFKISPAEASAMDPQQRLLLECAELGIADAGLTRDDLRGRDVGVFVGISNNPDAIEISLSTTRATVYAANATSNATAAGRVSFVFGLHGPCVAYDTACSSALVALHGAFRCLQRGEGSLAIVAGVNAMLTPTVSRAYANAGMTSATGRCHTFDAAADGYSRAEGCGTIVLAPAGSKLCAQGHQYATVKGVSVQQDGASASLTAPNGQAQKQLLHAALRDAQLTGRDVNYIEAHGTGTSLGDPIEMEALVGALDNGHKAPITMGGVKANIGHLEAAAGLAGLIKAMLVLHHKMAPPIAQLQTINPKIEAVVKDFPVHFPMALEPLHANSAVAGVSSFGYSGTIAHTIIASEDTPTEMSPPSMASLLPNRKAFPWRQLAHPLLQQTLELRNIGTEHTAVFHQTLMDLFKDHTIHGRVLFPGAGFIEMAVAAAVKNGSTSAVALHDVAFVAPFELSVGASLVCEMDNDSSMLFRSAVDSQPVCTVAKAAPLVDTSEYDSSLLAGAKERCKDEVTGLEARYTGLEDQGFHKHQFQTLAQVWGTKAKDELLAQLKLPPPTEVHKYRMHPAVLDGAIQLAWLVGGNATWVPASIKLYRSHAPLKPTGHAWATARVLEAATANVRVLDISVYDGAGNIVVSIEGFRFMAMQPQPAAAGMYEVHWPATTLSTSITQHKTTKYTLMSLPGCEDTCNNIAERLRKSGIAAFPTECDDIIDHDMTELGPLLVPATADADIHSLCSGGTAFTAPLDQFNVGDTNRDFDGRRRRTAR